MIIRKARLSDLNDIEKIYKTAISALKNAGVDQWQNGTPNAEIAKEDIENDVSYVAEIDGRVIATAVLYVGTEESYAEIRNGKWLTDSQNYGVIHRIAVHSDAKKQGVASKIVEKIVQMSKEKSATSVRCDTHIDNKIMQKTLDKNKFVYCGEVTI
ncbi:MAG: GNAT family N-acetyltransferase, partial [Clostridia bacterium]